MLRQLRYIILILLRLFLHKLLTTQLLLIPPPLPVLLWGKVLHSHLLVLFLPEITEEQIDGDARYYDKCEEDDDLVSVLPQYHASVV